MDLLCFCSVLCLLCFVRVCLYVLRGHLLGKGWPLGSRLWCLLWVFHFPIGILGQVWYLIVSIPDLCNLTYSNPMNNTYPAIFIFWAVIVSLFWPYNCIVSIKKREIINTNTDASSGDWGLCECEQQMLWRVCRLAWTFTALRCNAVPKYHLLTHINYRPVTGSYNLTFYRRVNKELLRLLIYFRSLIKKIMQIWQKYKTKYYNLNMNICTKNKTYKCICTQNNNWRIFRFRSISNVQYNKNIK